MSFFTKLFGDPQKKIVNDLHTYVEAVNALESEFEKKSQETLQQLTKSFKEKLRDVKRRSEREASMYEILPQAFAAVREAAKRTLHERHYDVQIIGGVVLHQGKIAEMKTGEGKTLTATLAIYLNALAGKGAHVVTVNDYLARRDTSWMGQIFNYLGLSVACLQQLGNAFIYDETVKKSEENVTEDDAAATISTFKVDMDHLKPCSRAEAYTADVTYGINSEFGFDYLRDNMVQSFEEKVQHGHSFAIIDEVDSILIDEARTPLIISAPNTKSADLYKRFALLVPQLKENVDYNKDEERHAVSLTEEGIQKMEQLLDVQNIFTEDVTLAHQLDQALKAHILYRKDKEYVVKEGEIVIVDQFTGRLMPGRRYSQGLHQAIEAKENVTVNQESKTLATITIQNYFRMYKKLSGMTGTAATEAEEFYKIYTLEVVVIPTHQKMVRNDKSDLIYKTEQGKCIALIEEIKTKYERGQPVLVGTISIEKNEFLSQLLNKASIPHKVLNAKQHESEAAIIAQAGKLKAVTVATNMAGRGVDIILGGNPQDKEEAAKVRDLGGLCVLGSERHEARRIDNQLRGRSGRQGDPGESRFFISLDDDLMRIFGSSRVKGVMDRIGLPEDMPIENKMISHSIEKAQQKVEGSNFDVRKHLVEYDDVINKQRATLYVRRDDILRTYKKGDPLRPIVFASLERELNRLLSIHLTEHTPNKEEILETLKAIPLAVDANELQTLLAKDRGEVLQNLIARAQENYEVLTQHLPHERVREIEKSILLRTLDTLWIDHLDAVEYLRVGIGLRGYGQNDPLVEYKKEAFYMYQTFLQEIDKVIVNNIYKMLIAYIHLAQKEEEKKMIAPVAAKSASVFAQTGTMVEQHESSSSFEKEMMKKGQNPYAGGRHEDAAHLHDTYTPADRNPNTGVKIGRNDACWCGSGKKYKKCHGA